MGANAQTTVPSFTIGQVLTADQQNQSARTGVPVFATTVERDAAFGGSGEKTLAEGQLAYLEDSDIVQYYDGSSWATVGPTTAGPTFTNAVVATEQTTTSTSYTDLATSGPAVTVTTGTTAFVILTSFVENSASLNNAFVGFAVSGATTVAATDDSSILVQVATGGVPIQVSAVYKVTLTAGSNTFTAKYRVGGNTGKFKNRGITVIAV